MAKTSNNNKGQDANLIAEFQPAEIAAARKEFKAKGITLTAENVRAAVREVGHSKAKVYEYLQKTYGDA